MACSSIRVWVVLCIQNVVAVLPRWCLRIKGIQIVKAKSVRSTATKQVELIVHVAKFHSCPWCRTFSFDFNLGPSEGCYLEYKQVIKPFGSIPTTEDIEVVLDDAWAMIRSGWWSFAFDLLHTSPMQCLCIQLMQVIQIVSTISSTENINLIFIAISRVHVAWAWWLTGKLVVEPFKFLEIKNVHIISCERSLSKPSTNDVKFVTCRNESYALSDKQFYLRTRVAVCPFLPWGGMPPGFTCLSQQSLSVSKTLRLQWFFFPS